MLGQIINVQPCGYCNGIGYSGGREKKVASIDIDIPKGVSEGMYTTVSSAGNHSIVGDAKGDLIVYFEELTHKLFFRQDNDVVLDCWIQYHQAVMGSNVNVPTLDGKVKLTIPSGIKSGQILRLRKKGINEVPVLGKIAAGTPIEAIQNEVSKVALPEELSKNGEHFGLKVSGDSMIEAGINDGDTVIVKKTNTANNGQIVVALIDDHEAMLKRIRKKGKVVALESANKRYETKIFGPDRVKVQGVLVSLYRNFQ